MNLFSHSDQEAQMQTAILDRVAETGWAGRTADKIQSIYGGNFPIIISLAGTNIFCEGVAAQSIQSNGNPTRLLNGFGGSSESTARLSALQSLLTFDTGLSLIQAASTTTGNAIQNGQTLAAALATGTPLATEFPQKLRYFASQLQQVAKIIQGKVGTGAAETNLLRIHGWFRHAQQSIGGSGLAIQRSERIYGCLLSGHDGNGSGE